MKYLEPTARFFHTNSEFISFFSRIGWGKSCVHPQGMVRKIPVFSQFIQESQNTCQDCIRPPSPWQPMQRGFLYCSSVQAMQKSPPGCSQVPEGQVQQKSPHAWIAKNFYRVLQAIRGCGQTEDPGHLTVLPFFVQKHRMLVFLLQCKIHAHL